MTAAADPTEVIKPKKSRLPMILGIVFAIIGVAGGFFAVKTGLIGGVPDVHGAQTPEEAVLAPLAPVAFVPIDPIVVNLPSGSGHKYLRFAAQVQVSPTYSAEVQSILPRIVDVLNGYLRAVKVSEMQDQNALVRLRGQMLRRVQVVAGEGRVQDLLIMEFVLD